MENLVHDVYIVTPGGLTIIESTYAENSIRQLRQAYKGKGTVKVFHDREKFLAYEDRRISEAKEAEREINRQRMEMEK